MGGILSQLRAHALQTPACMPSLWVQSEFPARFPDKHPPGLLFPSAFLPTLNGLSLSSALRPAHLLPGLRVERKGVDDGTPCPEAERAEL